jgi:signal transduction histidine kinase
MSNEKKLSNRLKYRYLYQAFYIGVAVIIGIVITYLLLSKLLVREALEREADYYWELIKQQPNTSLANTKNLKGFLIPRDNHLLPYAANQMAPGYHEYTHLKNFNVAYVSQGDSGKKLLLLFNRAGVDSLILLFGIIPLCLGLLLLYVSLWLSYKYSKKLLSPVIFLAKKVRSTDILNIDKAYFKSDNEHFQKDEDIITLASSISGMIERLEQFVERERHFTQDVSHELRSPISVIQMAMELINTNDVSSAEKKQHLKRIDNAAKDMEELTEFFLILAREDNNIKKISTVDVSEVIEEEIEKLSLMCSHKKISIIHNEKNTMNIEGSKKIISVLTGNLLRNALLYTDKGLITVSTSNNMLTIKDTGIGISKEKLDYLFVRENNTIHNERRGFGVGLSIVKRLCDQYYWDIDISSEKNQGTTVTVSFN